MTSYNLTIHTVTFGEGADEELMEEVALIGGGKHYHAASGVGVGGDLRGNRQQLAHDFDSVTQNRAGSVDAEPASGGFYFWKRFLRDTISRDSRIREGEPTLERLQSLDCLVVHFVSVDSWLGILVAIPSYRHANCLLSARRRRTTRRSHESSRFENDDRMRKSFARQQLLWTKNSCARSTGSERQKSVIGPASRNRENTGNDT